MLTFSAAASYDPDGTIVTNYLWIWGDNTAGSFGTVTATHSYANPGTYTVTLTVFDNDGATANDTLIVTVNAPPDRVTQALTTGEDTAVVVTLAATDADGDALTYAVAHGSGPRDALRHRAQPDLHAGGELQRRRQLHVHRERRDGRLERRDCLDHRHDVPTTRRWQPPEPYDRRRHGPRRDAVRDGRRRRQR